MERGNRKLQYSITFADMRHLVLFTVSIAALTMGVSQNWSTPVIPKFHENATHFGISDKEISWIAAISAPGYMIGSLISRYTSDQLGRRGTILSSAIPITIGTIMLLFSFNAWMICFSRFLWGMGSGMIGSVSAMYLAEIVDKDIRGMVSVGNRFSLNFGAFLVMSIGPFMSYETLNYMLLVLPVSYFAVCWWIPETPYYYLKEGNVEAARKQLQRLKGYEDDMIDVNLSSMRSDVRKEMSRSGSLKELLTGKQYRRAVTIVIGLKVTQIMSGPIAIQQYLGRIAQESKSNMQVSTVLIVYGALRFLIGIMSSLLVDKLGRRPLLIYTYFGGSIILTIIGAYFFVKDHYFDETSSSIYWFIPFTAIILFSIVSGLGYDSVVYVIPAEIFPLNVKSVAMTFVNILGGFVNFITVKAYQQIKDLLGLCGVFWFYATMAMLGVIFTYCIVPETKGKSLKDIQIQLQGNIYEDDSENKEGNEEKVENELNEFIRKDG